MHFTVNGLKHNSQLQFSIAFSSHALTPSTVKLLITIFLLQQLSMYEKWLSKLLVAWLLFAQIVFQISNKTNSTWHYVKKCISSIPGTFDASSERSSESNSSKNKGPNTQVKHLIIFPFITSFGAAFSPKLMWGGSFFPEANIFGLFTFLVELSWESTYNDVLLLAGLAYEPVRQQRISPCIACFGCKSNLYAF